MVTFMSENIIYRLHINLFTRTCVGIRAHGYCDAFFSEFVYDFECTLFDQPNRNPHSAQNDTQMEHIWVSYEK